MLQSKRKSEWKRLRPRGKSARATTRSQWARELKEYWQQRGSIEHCELKFKGCLDTYGLAPAHSLDRRFIHTREEYFEVVAACQKCHFTADREMPKDERLSIFKQVIANRIV